MLFIKLLRFLFGIVGFETEGGFAERFINLCYAHKIPLWGVSAEKGRIRAETSVGGYKRIRKAARRSAVHPHVLYKRGVPFVVRNNRFRVGILAAAVVSCLLVRMGSQRIWRIEVSGCTEIPVEQILESAESVGVTRGARRAELVKSDIEKKIAQENSSVLWVSANIKGSAVSIELREREKTQEITDTSKPTNVVAASDGYIQTLTIYRGDAVVGNRMAVTKGQLLISGTVTMKDGGTYPVRAQGECMARTSRTFSKSADMADFRRLTAFKEKKSLFFFGLQLPLSFGAGLSPVTGNEKDVGTDAFLLPIGLVKEQAFELKTVNDCDKAVLTLLSAAEFYRVYTQICGDAQILTREMDAPDPNTGRIDCRMTCIEDIAVEQPFEYEPPTEENGSETP